MPDPPEDGPGWQGVVGRPVVLEDATPGFFPPVLHRPPGEPLPDAQGRSFTWDFENRLTQAGEPSVGTTTFKYDPFGRRIQKAGPLGTTNYLYEGPNLIEELDNTGSYSLATRKVARSTSRCRNFVRARPATTSRTALTL